MNKAELIDLVAERADISKKDATSAVEAALDGIKNAVAKGDKVSLSGFGIFEKSDRAARTGRNPQLPDQPGPRPADRRAGPAHAGRTCRPGHRRGLGRGTVSSRYC